MLFRSSSYATVEYDLDAGGRGQRDSGVERLIEMLLQCEAACVVNNNAAAVMLILNTLAENGEVIVSRGELVEIGGSFRVPEIMAKSGVRLREVGSTNRTKIADYAAAISPATRLLLRVHRSNFRISGFTEQPAREEFVRLGQEFRIPTCEDLGSGRLEHAGGQLGDEPIVEDSIRAGVDVVCFSGDKLLGGPQAGIIAGKLQVVNQIRKNPLFRALRVDKLTLSCLEAVLRLHVLGEMNQIPAQRMLACPPDRKSTRLNSSH